MEKNFTIHAFAELHSAGREIDIHNLYGAVELGTDLEGQTITLRFKRDHRWKGPERLPELVTLTCTGSLSIAFNDLIDTPVPLRTDCVDLGYYDDHCEWDAMLDEELAQRQGFVGLHFAFSGGLVLRVRAEKAAVRFD
jgi:hypothetical protein